MLGLVTGAADTMEFREALSAVLPPRRSDEPAGLRQDILDELADHLTSSYHRELLRGSNSTDARARALERFGDPAAVARRLWLDAMKGRIMAKRVLIATCVMVTCASLSLAGVFWLRSNRAAQELARALAMAEDHRRLAEQAAAEANRMLADTFAQNQSANTEIVKQLQAMRKETQSPPTPDWIPVSFKLTEETLDGPPAVGCEVQFRGGQRLSDSSGVADFGVVRPGDWGFQIRRPWAENEGSWQLIGSINVLPGSKVVKSIICPKAPPDLVSLRLKFDWPPDLAGKELCVYAEMQQHGISYEPPSRWVAVAGARGTPLKAILSGPGTRQTDVKEESLQFWKVAGQQVREYERDPNQIYATLKSGTGAASAKDAIEIEPGTFSLLNLTVLHHRPHEDVAPVKGEAFELIARATRHPDDPQQPRYWSSFFEDTALGVGVSIPLGAVNVPKSYWRPREKTLQGKPGTVVEWTISLPDELIKAVRDKLKADPAAKTNQ